MVAVLTYRNGSGAGLQRVAGRDDTCADDGGVDARAARGHFTELQQGRPEPDAKAEGPLKFFAWHVEEDVGPGALRVFFTAHEVHRAFFSPVAFETFGVDPSGAEQLCRRGFLGIDREGEDAAATIVFERNHGHTVPPACAQRQPPGRGAGFLRVCCPTRCLCTSTPHWRPHPPSLRAVTPALPRTLPRALSSVLSLLCCPHGPESLHAEDGSLICELGHRFDVARQGYVNLVPAGTGHLSDTAAMIAARERVQSCGFFDPVADAIVSTLTQTRGLGGIATMLDLGAGTGYYSAQVLDAAPEAVGVGIDLSKYAARRAARAHPRLAALIADVWAPLPLLDGVFDAALSVFAPRNIPEIHRVLRPGAIFLVVTPEHGHLAELVQAVDGLSVGQNKQERLLNALANGFTLTREEQVRKPITLSHPQARDLLLMGPTAFHTEMANVETLLRPLPDPLTVTLDVRVQAFYRQPPVTMRDVPAIADPT